MFKHISTYFVGKIIPALFSVFIILFGYRIFGEEAYGLYALLFSTVVVVHDLSVGWIKQATLRYLSSYEKDNEPIHQIVKFGWISSILTTIIIYIVGTGYFKLDVVGLLWVIAFAVIYNVYQIRQTINQAQFKSRTFAWMETGYAILSAGIILIMAYLFKHKGYEVFFIAFFIGLSMMLLIRYLVQSTKSRTNNSASTDESLIKKMMSFGGMLTIWMFLAQLFNIADRYLIVHFLGLSEVGNYSAVYDLLF